MAYCTEFSALFDQFLPHRRGDYGHRQKLVKKHSKFSTLVHFTTVLTADFRIIFTVMISNTDDHLRNHGFVYERYKGWRLSLAYDMNPTPLEIIKQQWQ
jgi:serine/threonine protein kinase HipA of HipAB toxin-antitoxin module